MKSQTIESEAKERRQCCRCVGRGHLAGHPRAPQEGGRPHRRAHLPTRVQAHPTCTHARTQWHPHTTHTLTHAHTHTPGHSWIHTSRTPRIITDTRVQGSSMHVHANTHTHMCTHKQPPQTHPPPSHTLTQVHTADCGRACSAPSPGEEAGSWRLRAPLWNLWSHRHRTTA